MTPERLYQTRQSSWEQLSALLKKSEGSINGLSPSDVQTVATLYRSATADLALAQRDFPNAQVTAYLNELVGRSHAVVYRSKPVAWQKIGRYFTHTFPQTFRQTLRYTLIAAILFFLPALIIGPLVYANPQLIYVAMDPGIEQLVDIVERGELWIDVDPNESSSFSAMIMTNNIRVTFLAYAGGMLAGVLTLYVMIFNGIMLGALTGLTAHHGLGWDLWEFVIGHGVIELSVICIAGGAGLMVGWAILNPGLQSRGDAIAIAAKSALNLVIGGAILLIIAGLIEGYISPHEGIPRVMKWCVGIGSGILMYLYLFLSGRESAESR